MVDAQKQNKLALFSTEAETSSVKNAQELPRSIAPKRAGYEVQKFAKFALVENIRYVLNVMGSKFRVGGSVLATEVGSLTD